MATDGYVEGFPPGTIVENVGETAMGSMERMLVGRTWRGTVITSSEQDEPRNRAIHVSFPDDYEGHNTNNIWCNGHCYFLLAEELRIISMPTDICTAEASAASMTRNIPPEIPRLRVTIARNLANYNQWGIRIENGPVPTKYEVKEYMDIPTARRLGSRIWNNFDLNNIIHRGIETYGVNPDIFIAAITQASLAKQARDATGTFERQVVDSELQKAIGSQPAIIAIGDQLFSLQPRGVVKANRAMAVIRERIVKAAKEQAIKIKVAATAEAATLIRNGERQLETARRQIESERAAITNIMTIPPWMGAAYLKVRKWDSDSYHMAVGMEIGTKVVSYQLAHSTETFREDDPRHRNPIRHSETIIWRNSPSHPEVIARLAHYHTVTVWVPFNPLTGSYAYKSCKVIDGENPYCLPHIGSNRCCMDLQGLPKQMTNMEEYNQIKAAINRGNSEVNMMSLLWGFNCWHPDMQAQTPKTLKKLIDNGRYNAGHSIEDCYFVDAERIPVEVEARETFNIDSLTEARRARGEELPDISLPIMDGLVEDVEEEVEEDEEHL